jgi:hypothetical protein
MTRPSDYGDADYETVDLTPQDLEPHVSYLDHVKEYERIQARLRPQTYRLEPAAQVTQVMRTVTANFYSGAQGVHGERNMGSDGSEPQSMRRW